MKDNREYVKLISCPVCGEGFVTMEESNNFYYSSAISYPTKVPTCKHCGRKFMVRIEPNLKMYLSEM